MDETKLREYRVVWCQCPHVHHAAHVLFVNARNEHDAIKLVRNHVERKLGIEWFTVEHPTEVTEALPPGGVIERR